MGQTKEDKNKEKIELLLEYIKNTQYGTISAVIQDGVIVQIEKNEKIRLV